MPVTPTTAEARPDFAWALIGASPLPLLLFDSHGRVASSSRSFHSQFGVPLDEVNGRGLGEIAGGGWNTPQLAALLDNALGGGETAADYELDLLRPDAHPRRLSINVQALPQGEVHGVHVLMAITDLTQLRDVERLNIALLLQKDELLRDRANLLDEMQHRIGNSLQIIASVLRLKAAAAKSEEARRHLREAHNRVMSLAAVQQHLQHRLGDVDVEPYLTKLCESLTSSMIREGRDLTLRVDADEAVIGSREAMSLGLGLVVTELVINALKHAFPRGRDGRIEVSYRVEPEGWTLTVSDNGAGMPAAAPSDKAGLGAKIVQGLAKQLRAKVVFSDAAPGLTVRIQAIRPQRQA